MKAIIITFILLMTSHTSIMSEIQGRWVSEEDPKSSISIKGDRWVFEYGGVHTNDDIYKLEIWERIPIYPERKSDYIVILNSSDTMYYELDAIGNKQMTLTYLPRGNSIIYIRK